MLWQLRRAKDADEVEIIRSAIAATEAAFDRAQNILKPGITEVEVFAQMHEAVLSTIGEPIGEFGNDFQFGSPGGLPRWRPGRSGEVAILDISVTVRGYTSDLSRSFVIGGEPSPAQRDALRRIEEVQTIVKEAVRVGLRCSDLYAMAHKMLNGYRGWRFLHHLGHGIGLSAHEAPRLNPNWDDQFQVGDVFAVEPGLYADELRSGLRIEDNYLLTSSGLEQLSSFPVNL